MQVSWAPGTEWEVAAGMLDIFHKLPSQAKKFLETHGEAHCHQDGHLGWPAYHLCLVFWVLCGYGPHPLRLPR